MGRDTIPAFTFDLLAADDPTVDHIEFVNTAWDKQLVDRVTSFLRATDLIDSAQAGQISSQFVPEPTAASMAAFGLLGLLGLRRRR